MRRGRRKMKRRKMKRRRRRRKMKSRRRKTKNLKDNQRPAIRRKDDEKIMKWPCNAIPIFALNASRQVDC
jgi:hypothetical protein